MLAAGPSALERELQVTRQALRDRTEVLALTRKRLKRETKTSKARQQQLAKRGSKAQKKLSRKLFAKQARGVAGAARKERERIRKRKQPEGEILHSGERKHQRRLATGVAVALPRVAAALSRVRLPPQGPGTLHGLRPPPPPAPPSPHPMGSGAFL